MCVLRVQEVILTTALPKSCVIQLRSSSPICVSPLTAAAKYASGRRQKTVLLFVRASCRFHRSTVERKSTTKTPMNALAPNSNSITCQSYSNVSQTPYHTGLHGANPFGSCGTLQSGYNASVNSPKSTESVVAVREHTRRHVHKWRYKFEGSWSRASSGD